MTSTKHGPSGSLTIKDLELIERIIFKSGDDLAVGVARSCERLEERIDAMESRMYSRLAEIEDQIEDADARTAPDGREALKASVSTTGMPQ